jgi:RNA polymerase sigma factor (sigma-70 family)
LATEITLNPQLNLIERCKRQEMNALQDFYTQNYQSVFNTANFILRDKVEAEDVMQETFITAYDRLDDLEDTSKVESWLKAIARNKSLNQIKKRKHWSDFEEEKEVVEASSEDHAFEEVDLTYIYKCIGALPEGYRVILTLYLLEGLDHDEISSYLGISGSTSRSQYTRARQKLRELIENNNERFA